MQSLLNHLWQSTAFAAAMALLTLAMKRNSANVRFCLWLAASLKFLLPFSALIAAGSQIHLDAPLDKASSQWASIAVAIAEPAQPMRIAAVIPVASEKLGSVNFLTIVWGIGFGVVMLRWLVVWLRINRTISDASPIKLDFPVSPVSSPAFHEPGVFGIFRPVLALPEGLRDQLSPQQFASILTHELFHVRRRDNLTAAIHMVVEALFWFHPLVWWIGARMLEERERACDEAVIEAGRPREIYAESILKVCMLSAQRGLPFIAGVASGHLETRIEGIMRDPIPLRFVRKAFFIIVGLATLVVPLVAGIVRSPHAIVQMTPVPAEDPATVMRAQRFAEQAKIYKAVPIDAKFLDAYVGYYRRGAIIFRITRDGNRLLTQITGQPAFEVFPYDDHEFFQPEVHFQLTFAGGDYARAADLIQHQDGLELKYQRIDDAEGRSLVEALAKRVKNKIEQPGSEEALQHYLDEANREQISFEQLTPQLAELARAKLPVYKQLMVSAGALQSIRFKGVLPVGLDVYEVNYENATWEWQIALGTHNEIIALWGDRHF